MLRLFPLLVLLTGCRSCAERRAERAEERAMEELLPALEVEPVEVVAEVEEREDGGVEAWGEAYTSTMRLPDGWEMWTYDEPESWYYDVDNGLCPDDVPLATMVGSYPDAISEGSELNLEVLAGGCDAVGRDLRGEYETGFIVTFFVCATGECSFGTADDSGYKVPVVVPVMLTIE